jgi:hypothetical protein
MDTTRSMASPAPETPRTDGWVWASVGVLAASFCWTIFMFGYALVPDRCEYAQCVRSLATLIGWAYPQFLAALPTLAALGVLIRYQSRGNITLPRIGIGIFVANVALSAFLIWYISTLPLEFR